MTYLKIFSSTSQIKQISNVSDHIHATTQMKQRIILATQINSANSN